MIALRIRSELGTICHPSKKWKERKRNIVSSITQGAKLLLLAWLQGWCKLLSCCCMHQPAAVAIAGRRQAEINLLAYNWCHDFLNCLNWDYAGGFHPYSSDSMSVWLSSMLDPENNMWLDSNLLLIGAQGWQVGACLMKWSLLVSCTDWDIQICWLVGPVMCLGSTFFFAPILTLQYQVMAPYIPEKAN